jgi:L-ascorbate metabolism protein UlaG (beta-lactamase superfamily)
MTTSCFASLGAHPAPSSVMKNSKQWSGEKFVNNVPSTLWSADGMWSSTIEWFTGDQQRVPPAELPITHDVAEQLRAPPTKTLRVTWLGHSTLLVEIDGVRLLTDPVWGERASPSTLVGPKRFHPPPIAIDDLFRTAAPQAILISHDHYDHLDYETIRALAQRNVAFFCPLGVGAHLASWGVPTSQIHEHDWWDEIDFASIKIVNTPAHHFSGRALIDGDATLWSSWTLIGPTKRVFFSGDTGLTPDFDNIAQRYGPFDLAMLEVGAYDERWGDIHLGPHKAMQAFEMLHAHVLLPIHWGTFNLALHAWDDPAETLTKLANEKGIVLITPRLGAPIEPPAPTDAWWRTVTTAPGLAPGSP